MRSTAALALLAACWTGRVPDDPAVTLWRDWGTHVRDDAARTNCADLELIAGEVPRRYILTGACQDVVYGADGEYWYCRFQEMREMHEQAHNWIYRALQLCREEGGLDQ